MHWCEGAFVKQHLLLIEIAEECYGSVVCLVDAQCYASLGKPKEELRAEAHVGIQGRVGEEPRKKTRCCVDSQPLHTCAHNA